MNFQIQSAGGRIFLVETMFGTLFEIGNGQYMTRVIVEEGAAVGHPASIRLPKVAAYDADADRAAVVGTATRVIGERTFVGQFQPDDDQQAVDGHEQGNIDGPGTLTIRERLASGRFDLAIDAPCLSRAVAWQMFDTFIPEPDAST